LDNRKIEGEVPQQRRYDIEDAYAPIQEKARDIGKELGKDKMIGEQ
jgi:hypothetical protein